MEPILAFLMQVFSDVLATTAALTFGMVTVIYFATALYKLISNNL